MSLGSLAVHTTHEPEHEATKDREGKMAPVRIRRLSGRDRWAGYGLPVPLDLLDAPPAKDSPSVRPDPDRLRLSWVVPPLTSGSGGLDNIARMIVGRRERGHVITVHVLNPTRRRDGEIRAEAHALFPAFDDVV